METMKIYERKERPQINNAESIYQFMQDLKDTDKEVFVVFYLDTKNKIIAREIVGIGILDATIIHPREVFRGAILRNSANIIISHNHPSGDTDPSKEDIEVTEKLKEAGKILGIKLLDHVIVGDGYKSIISEVQKWNKK